MTIGYLAIGHAFTYIGIVPLNLYIGELVLGWFMLTRQDGIRLGLTSKNKYTAVELVRFSFVLFMIYGVVCVINGFVRQLPPFAILQCTAFNYYAIYLFVGIWVAVNNAPFLKEWAMGLAWVQGIYGVAWVLYLNRLDYHMQGLEWVPLFSQPCGEAVAILALLCFEPRFTRVALLMLMNLFVLLGVQVRAEWVGFIVAASVWAVLSKRIGQFCAFLGIVACLLFIGLVFDIRLPGASGRGGEISVQGVVGRSLATVDPSAASKYLDITDSESVNGTVKWREDWWHAILLSINKGDAAMYFLGHGYGFPISSLAAVGGLIRTPHSIFFFALGYTGWVGVGIFYFFQLTLLYALYRVYLINRQPFGIVFWFYQLSVAHFGMYLESPTGAIPFYIIVGICISPLFESPEARAMKQRMVMEQDMPRQARQPAWSQPGFAAGVLAGPGAIPADRALPPPARKPVVWR
jgi:hypothetical protein